MLNTTSMTAVWLCSRRVWVLNWPACSLDLSPGKTIGGILKHTEYEKKVSWAAQQQHRSLKTPATGLLSCQTFTVKTILYHVCSNDNKCAFRRLANYNDRIPLLAVRLANSAVVFFLYAHCRAYCKSVSAHWMFESIQPFVSGCCIYSCCKCIWFWGQWQLYSSSLVWVWDEQVLLLFPDSIAPTVSTLVSTLYLVVAHSPELVNIKTFFWL